MKKKTKKLVSIVMLILLMSTGLFIFIIYVSVGYGGLQGYLQDRKSPPTERKLEPLRSNIVTELREAHNVVVPPNGIVYEETYSDMCIKGTHNWKVNDSYAYRCVYRMSIYYGIDTDYEKTLLELERSLIQDGWEEDGYNSRLMMQDLIVNYNEHIQSGETYLIQTPRYIKEGPKQSYYDQVELYINSFNGSNTGVYWQRYNSSKSQEPSVLSSFGSNTIRNNHSEIVPKDVFESINESNQKMLMITIKKEYFQN